MILEILEYVVVFLAGLQVGRFMQQGEMWLGRRHRNPT